MASILQLPQQPTPPTVNAQGYQPSIGQRVGQLLQGIPNLAAGTFQTLFGQNPAQQTAAPAANQGAAQPPDLSQQYGDLLKQQTGLTRRAKFYGGLQDYAREQGPVIQGDGRYTPNVINWGAIIGNGVGAFGSARAAKEQDALDAQKLQLNQALLHDVVGQNPRLQNLIKLRQLGINVDAQIANEAALKKAEAGALFQLFQQSPTPLSREQLQPLADQTGWSVDSLEALNNAAVGGFQTKAQAAQEAARAKAATDTQGKLLVQDLKNQGAQDKAQFAAQQANTPEARYSKAQPYLLKQADNYDATAVRSTKAVEKFDNALTLLEQIPNDSSGKRLTLAALERSSNPGLNSLGRSLRGPIAQAVKEALSAEHRANVQGLKGTGAISDLENKLLQDPQASLEMDPQLLAQVLQRSREGFRLDATLNNYQTQINRDPGLYGQYGKTSMNTARTRLIDVYNRDPGLLNDPNAQPALLGILYGEQTASSRPQPTPSTSTTAQPSASPSSVEDDARARFRQRMGKP